MLHGWTWNIQNLDSAYNNFTEGGTNLLGFGGVVNYGDVCLCVLSVIEESMWGGFFDIVAIS